MISTQSTTSVRLVADGSPLLAQVIAPLGNSKYRVGKLAYDYLNSIADRPAQELSGLLSHLGYGSIGERDLTSENEAALAVAAAAILDSSKNRRLTVSEQLEAASDYLDKELAAGW